MFVRNEDLHYNTLYQQEKLTGFLDTSDSFRRIIPPVKKKKVSKIGYNSVTIKTTSTTSFFNITLDTLLPSLEGSLFQA